MSKHGKLLALVLVGVLAFAVVGTAGCQPSTTTTGTEGTEATGTAEEATTPDLKLVTPGQITVGSDTTFPPMESMNGNVAEGFDVDLMSAIGREIGLKVVFQTEGWDSLIPNLEAGGKFDVIASGMTILPERALKVNFTDPYFDSNQSIAMKKGGKYAAPADFRGKKIGVQTDTTGQTWATENLKPAGATIVPFKTTTEAFSALQAGNVAAVVNDLPVTVNIVKDPAKGLVIVKEIPTGEQYGYAVSKDNPELLKALNEGLAKVRASGEYKAIYDKWITQG